MCEDLNVRGPMRVGECEGWGVGLRFFCFVGVGSLCEC